MGRKNNLYKVFLKRFLDIFFSLLIFPLFIIVLLIVAPLIYTSDKGSIFYCGERLGKNGKIFKMIKFRSMKINSQDIRNEDGTTFNSQNDPRLTRIGKVLRKISIDELPQLINVLKGDMSFVGPRPDLPDALLLYSGNYIDKLKVLPGITGYNQAYFRNSVSINNQFENDCLYVKNYNLILDFKIILKTFFSTIMSKNIYRK
jgi:lipopolysaccharide/colanic/teichoic acid biosynthesis glycosyltransferase